MDDVGKGLCGCRDRTGCGDVERSMGSLEEKGLGEFVRCGREGVFGFYFWINELDSILTINQ